MIRTCLAPLALLLASGAAHGQVAAEAQVYADLPVVDHVVVEKSARTITLRSNGAPVRIIEGIQFGDAPIGHKRFQGDERTPEGRYLIDYGNPQSSYYLSLHISYPNEADRAYARSQGRSPGGAIFIHGQPNGYSGRVQGDWTDGCIAVTNEEIEYMWQTVPNGTVIDILP
ncbi:hypothetical protein GCM10011371_31860 [Novosphingobium marinum]|uniref:Murein L,D-transpeptidase YafK n=1 Tax=Novosphingobium marinum TaxID=1514948 RepID=A0A7Y9XYJ3_9SPHN|nr:L,D-transpeptidase family protein [Novosphingobium marinum]NYH96954.1 murein L,D-transpeptidase YafK [Novosphingobium marinum]GGC42071.1 hypothetical protein GCM10011371_31860 [Novosphingobium marinum]